MRLTKSLTKLVQRRAARDPEFAAALLREGVDTTPAGDEDTDGLNLPTEFTQRSVPVPKDRRLIDE